jgi:hypothetical protein
MSDPDCSIRLAGAIAPGGGAPGILDLRPVAANRLAQAHAIFNL